MLGIDKYIEEMKTVKMIQTGTPRFLKVEAYVCELNNGRTIKREKLLKNNNDGSASIVFPLTTDRKVILAIEPRVFTESTVGIDLPAGYIEDGETPIDAAKRELLEETGYESNEFIDLGSFYQDQGVSSACNHYFLATNCKKVQDQSLDSSEYITYVLVTLDELRELLEKGYIKSLNSAFAIEKGKRYLKEMK